MKLVRALFQQLLRAVTIAAAPPLRDTLNAFIQQIRRLSAIPTFRFGFLRFAFLQQRAFGNRVLLAAVAQPRD